jgi:hypothetical protein
MGEVIPALGKRDRNRKKLLPAGAPPTKKNKTTSSTIPTPTSLVEPPIAQNLSRPPFYCNTNTPTLSMGAVIQPAHMQIPIVAGTTRRDHSNSSFSWDTAANTTPADNAPQDNHGQPQTPTPPLPLPHSVLTPTDAATRSNGIPPPPQHPPVPAPVATSFNHTTSSSGSPLSGSDLQSGQAFSSSNPLTQDTSTRTCTRSTPSGPNADVTEGSTNPPLDQPPITLGSPIHTDSGHVLFPNPPLNSGRDLPTSPSLPHSCSRDVASTPGIDGIAQDAHAQAQGSPGLARAQLNSSSFSWGVDPPVTRTDTVLQSARTRTPIPGIARGDHSSSSFSWDTVNTVAVDKAPPPTNRNDPAPTGSPTLGAPHSSRGTDGMETEQLPPTRPPVNPDRGSFYWDNAPPSCNPGGVSMEEIIVSQSFHAQPLSCPPRSPPPGHGTDRMEAEQLLPTRPLANSDHGSFCWDNLPSTHSPGDDVRMEESPQPVHARPHTPSTSHTPPTHNVDMTETELLSPASTPMNIDRNSFYWDDSPPNHDPGEDTRMEENDSPQPFHARSIPRPSRGPLPDHGTNGRVELPVRPLANPDRGSFRWDNAPPTRNPGGDVPMEENTASQHAHARTHSASRDPSVPGRRTDRIEVEPPLHGPTPAGVARGSFNWENTHSALNPGGGQTPLPQPPRPPPSRDPRLQTWGTNVNRGSAPSKFCCDPLAIGA